MPPAFTFAHALPFSPVDGSGDITASSGATTQDTRGLLRHLPEGPGILGLFGPPPVPGQSPAQPFLTRTSNLRRRAERLLLPPQPREQALSPTGTPLPSRRLNLRDRVAEIRWSATGSEFESLLTLYYATAHLFGLPEARRRLRLHTPFFVRFSATNAHPRVFVSNRLSRASLDHTFGPFPSRLAAERYADAVLDLFKLRRCWEDLVVHPDHPGCAYGEMKKCLAPCNTSCSAETYAEEAAAVLGFLSSNGASLLASTTAARDAASANMEFEQASDLHRQVERIKAAVAFADSVIAPVTALRAIIVQPAAAAAEHEHPEAAALFLLQAGSLSGPARLSTLGVRAVREQTAVGSSLFAQPLMLAAVPLSSDHADPSQPPSDLPGDSPEDRAKSALATLETTARENGSDPALLSDHLALLRRWYFRPEKQRTGEFLQPNPDGSWPLRRLLNAAARAALGDPRPMQATSRDDAKALKTRLLHAGRKDVERAVPVLPPAPSTDPVFRSRRARKPSGATDKLAGT